MRTIITVVTAAVFVTSFGLLSAAQACSAGHPSTPSKQAQAEPAKKAGKPQTLCPVMGNPIDKQVFTDYQGKRVYFCCSGCIETFTKEPAKYLKKMADEGIVLEDAPAAK